MASEALVEAIGQQKTVGNIADAVQPAVRETLQRAGSLKDFLHGVWLGHSLHPVLTDVPVGAWTAAMVFDGAALLTNSESMEAAADASVAVGLAGALGSAVTGLTDWSETDASARNIGLVHGSLNVTATALYVTSLILRRGGRRSAGVGASLLGYAIAGFSAYLGGHLTYGEQIGVDHTATADRSQPEEWTAVAREEELQENAPKRVDAGDAAIVLVKQGDSIRALSHTCSHLGGPLSEGKVEGDTIQCPWHGSRFCLDDGSVANGPATFRARCFDVRVRDGAVEVRARKE